MYGTKDALAKVNHGKVGGGPSSSYYLNVKDFGAEGHGSTDDTAAIQAAIDYAYDNKIATVYMPSGKYKTTGSIWLDAPGNARVNYNNPPNSN